MHYIIKHDSFDGEEYASYSDVADAIEQALMDENIEVCEVEELEIYKIENPISASVEVTYNVSIG